MALVYLTASATIEEVLAAYENNSTYALESDADKCRMFIQACIIYIGRMSSLVQHQGAQVQEDYRRIEKQLDEAKNWLKSQDEDYSPQASGAVRYVDLSRMRE